MTQDINTLLNLYAEVSNTIQDLNVYAKSIKKRIKILRKGPIIEIKKIPKPKSKWTFDKCKEEAIRYSSKSEFRKYSRNAYQYAQKNGWLIELYKLYPVIPNIPKQSKWTFDKCKEEFLKHQSLYDFRNKSMYAYQCAQKKGWLEELYKLNPDALKVSRSKLKWTFDKCKEEAIRYSSKSEFRINSRNVYQYACNKGWLKEICLHFQKKEKKNNPIDRFKFKKINKRKSNTLLDLILNKIEDENYPTDRDLEVSIRLQQYLDFEEVLNFEQQLEFNKHSTLYDGWLFIKKSDNLKQNEIQIRYR